MELIFFFLAMSAYLAMEYPMIAVLGLMLVVVGAAIVLANLRGEH